EGGTTIIDATEGGLAKEHSTRMTLKDALARYAITPALSLASTPLAMDRGRLRRVIDTLRERQRDFTELRKIAAQTLPLLRQMLEHQRDEVRVAELFEKIDRHRKRVTAMKATFDLVNELNTLGAFRRARADRAIRADGDLRDDGFTRQARQIERDLDNVELIVQACDETLAIIRDAVQKLEKTSEAKPSPY